MGRLSTLSTTTLGTVVVALGITVGAPAASADGAFVVTGVSAPQTPSAAPAVCPYFSSWVYVSPAARSPYNAEAPFTTDDLGASAPTDGTSADGVSIELTADGRGVRVRVDELVDPETTILLTRIAVQTGASYTLFSNEALRSDGTVLDPRGDELVDHAFACYEPLPLPPAVIPEVPWSAALPLSGAAALGAVVLVRARRQRVAGGRLPA